MEISLEIRPSIHHFTCVHRTLVRTLITHRRFLHACRFAICIGLFCTSISYSQWTQVYRPSRGYVYCFAILENLGTKNILVGTANGGVYATTDEGTTWTDLSISAATTEVYDLIVVPNNSGSLNLFAGTWDGVFRSSDDGKSWSLMNNGLKNFSVYDLHAYSRGGSDMNLIAGTRGGVYLSTNNGELWFAINTGLTNHVVYAVQSFDDGKGNSILFAGTYGSGIFRSTNGGATWAQSNTGLPANMLVSPIITNGNSIFIGADAGVYRSTDNGNQWTAARLGLPRVEVIALAVHEPKSGDKQLFAGSYRGVFFSTDKGDNWIETNHGLTNTYVHALLVKDSLLFAGTRDGVWKRSLSNLITSEKLSEVDVQAFYRLEQNYPNPFGAASIAGNPSTSISIYLPIASRVTLRVLDIFGREIQSLVSGELPAGKYSQTWDAAGLHSGMYFYQLIAQPKSGSRDRTFIETKSLMFIR